MTEVLDSVLQAYRAFYLAAQAKGPCSPEVVKYLEAHGNASTDWSRVFLTILDGDGNLSNCISIRNCFFDPGNDGSIIIVSKKGMLEVDGVLMSNRLHNSNFYGTCVLAQGSLVINTTTLSNVFIGSNCAVVGCGTVRGPDVGSVTTFGNYETVSVGSESGRGRSVMLDMGITFYDICRQAFLGVASCASKFARIEFNLTVLSTHVKLLYCDKIENCLLLDFATVSRSSLTECTLKSSAARPTTARTGAQMQFCLLNEGCVIEDGCYCDHVYMCEASSIGVHARVCDSILSADASIAGGECHRSLVGPFIGFHHHSLLIASLWPFGRGNLGYGAKVGANHTGRVNDQESWPGEGCFFGLGCSIKFPMNLYNSPYSIVAPDTAMSPQCVQFPYSLICPVTPLLASTAKALSTELPVDACLVKPAWILYANPYMMERAISKFSSRRKAKHLNTSFPVYRPTIINKMILARSRIQSLLNSNPVVQSVLASKASKVTYVTEKQLIGLGRCVASVDDLQKAVRGYSAVIRRYALHGLLYNLLTISNAVDLQAFVTSLGVSSKSASESAPVATSVDTLETSLKDMVDAVVEDLNYYNSDPQFIIQQTLHSHVTAGLTEARTVLLQDTHTVYMNKHQLQVLSTEYAELLSTHTETKMIVGTLLSDLVEIEKAYAGDVRDSRQKDGERGITVIPDYERVNKAAVDIGSDAVVTAALRRAQDILHLVQGVQAKFDGY